MFRVAKWAEANDEILSIAPGLLTFDLKLGFVRPVGKKLGHCFFPTMMILGREKGIVDAW